GAMAAYVSSQYSVDEIWQYHINHDEVHPNEEAHVRPLAARIRAFDVPALQGLTFTVSRLCDIAPALQTLVPKRLPTIEWKFGDAALLARIKKYGLIHEVVEAPRDEATGEPMALEVYGRLGQVNGEPAGISWYRQLHIDDPAGNGDMLIGELTFQLHR